MRPRQSFRKTLQDIGPLGPGHTAGDSSPARQQRIRHPRAGVPGRYELDGRGEKFTPPFSERWPWAARRKTDLRNAHVRLLRGDRA